MTRRPVWLALAALVCGAVLACAASAQPALRTLGGGLFYAVPEGWAERPKGHSVQLSPVDLPAGEVCTVLVGPLCQANGKDARAYLGDLLDAELKDGAATVVKTGEPTPHRSAQGLNGYSLVRVLRHAEGYDTLRVYVVTQVGPADVQTTVWVSSSEEILNRYEPGVRQILGYLRFPNAARAAVAPTAPPPPPPATLPAELHGLYTATGFLAAAGISRSTSNSYYYFLPGRRVFQGLPEGGLESFDWDRACKASPDRCGTYAIDGKSLSIRFANGDAIAREVAATPRGLRVRNIEFEPVAALGAGKLRGTYESVVPGPAAADGAETCARATYTFTADGHFTWSQSAFLPAGAKMAGMVLFKRGSYAAKGNTLSLAFDDGSTSQETAWVYAADANNPSPEVVNVAGNTYVLNNAAAGAGRK